MRIHGEEMLNETDEFHSMKASTILISLTLFLSFCLNAQGQHLKAAYAVAHHDVKNITAFYREVEVVDLPQGTYSAISFTGGYVGLAMRNPHINFSIWDTKVKGKIIGQAKMIKSSKMGTPDNHRFGHEGSGYHTELDFKWKPGVRYKVYVEVEHLNENTRYSAYFGEVAKEWHFIATIERPGIHYLRGPGGFLEHVGKKLADQRRATTYYGAWVSDGERWEPVTKIKYNFKDPTTANAIFKDNGVTLQIGQGIRSQYEKNHIFEIEALDRPEFPN